MSWSDVGSWIKDNAGGILGLAGSVATGNVAGGVAAVASMVSKATGTDDPTKALARLQQDPATMIELERIALEKEKDIRAYYAKTLELQLSDLESAHKEQQETIRNGDNATDQYVRRTRPFMARISFFVGSSYIVLMEILKAFNVSSSGASYELASILLSPCLAYMGFRTWDKIKGVQGTVK